MPPRYTGFERMTEEAAQMSAGRCRSIVNVHQDDEHFVLRVDDFAPEEAFTTAIDAEIIKLAGLG